jgi:hypothetical protein
MQAIATSLSPTCGRADAVRHREGTQSSHLTQVQAETHTSADITLVTAEGDKVTLSTDAVLQAAYTRYDARGHLRGYGLERHAETFQMTSADDISLQIAGDLNDAERADIQQALDTIEQFADDFFHGKGNEAPHQIFNLGNLNTLRSIDANLEFSQSLTVSQRTEARAVATAPPEREPNVAALEVQPSTTRNPKSLLDAILHAIETARVAVAQPQSPGKISSALPLS